jgi:hypothetical protein
MPAPTEVSSFFASRTDATWGATGPLDVKVDGVEVLVVVPLADGTDVTQWREDTRHSRMAVADAAQDLFRRKVSWGVQVGDERTLFSHLSLPVMTRLRLPERAVLDTLIEAGVARSRSEAVAWCIRLVGQHEADWLAELRAALEHVEQARTKGPTA